MQAILHGKARLAKAAAGELKASGAVFPGFEAARALLLASGLLFFTGCSPQTPEGREALHTKKGQGYLEAKDYRRAAIEFKIASQNMPNDAEPMYQLGMTYLAGGAGTLAAQALQKAVALNPRHSLAQYQLARMKVAANNPELLAQARDVLSDFLSRHPNDTDAMANLALADAKLGNKTEVLRLLQTLGQKDPKDLRTATVVIAVFVTRGDIASADEISRRLAELLPNSPDAAVLRAQVLMAKGDLPGSDTENSRALALKRDFKPALQLLLRRQVMNRDKDGAEKTTQALSQLPDKEMWSAYARMLFAEKRIDEGIAEFTRMLKIHGDDGALRDEYTTLLMTSGRNKEASAVLAATLAKNPKDLPALLKRTALEIDAGNLDAASADVRAQLDLKAQSSPLSYQQSRIAGMRGDKVRQGDLLTEALRYNPRALKARLELSRLLAESGKGQNALIILDEADQFEKKSAEYVFYRNLALMSAGKWDEARTSVNVALASIPSAGFLFQDAEVRLRNKDLAGARKSLEAALAIAPADMNVLNLLGEVLGRQGQTQHYLVLLKDALAKNPGSTELRNALGREMASMGDPAAARAVFESSRAGGDVVNSDNSIAVLDIRAGAFDAAKQRLTNLTRIHDNARTRLLLAEIETRKGSANAAIAHYLRALQLEPASALAMNNLAELLADQGKYGDALFYAQKALALAPGSAFPEDTLGWIYYRQGNYAAAVPHLETAGRALNRGTIHYHLAAALLKSGDPVRARKEYDFASQLEPQSEARNVVAPLFAAKAQK